MMRFLGVILAVLTVAGCSAGGPLYPPPLDPTAAGAPRGIDQDWMGRLIYASDGEPLRMHIWPSRKPDGSVGKVGSEDFVIVAVHGYGDHATSTYAEAADGWTDAGATVYAYDQRGFGRNRSRGSWPGPDALVDDLATVIQGVAERHPDKPIVLVGHSMGGGVSLTALGEGRVPDVDAAVLLAPAVRGGDALPTHLRLLTWLAATLMPDKRLTGSGFVEVKPTDNYDLLKKLAADPWYLKYPSPREYMGVVRLMDRAVASAPNVNIPVAVLWGANDVIIPPEAIQNALKRLPDTVDYVEYSEGWHMLLRDNQGKRVRSDVVSWARKHVSDQPAVASAEKK
ncbi:MAG: lysophospholipase [Rhodobacteraceae bacterium]|nr:lysophospholipase [Paracoccaceae bacterium]